MKEDLVILADELDKVGYHKEANKVDFLLSKVAADYSQAAEDSGLSQESLMAITELLMRISRSAECVQAINAASSDSHISEDELLALIEQGCVRDDDSGVSEEYARRSETAVGLVQWAKEHPGLASLIGLGVSVLVGATFSWIVRIIKRKLKRSKAKKLLKAQQASRALSYSGPQAFTEEKVPTAEQMQALRESKSNKYLAAIAKGYVDVKIAHNLPSYETIKVEYVDISFNISGFGADLNCPNIMVRVPIALFESDSNLTFKVGDIRSIRLNFGSKLFTDSLIATQLKNKCEFFHGFEKSLVIPEIKSIRFSNGADMGVKFVDGLEIYQGQTLNLNRL